MEAADIRVQWLTNRSPFFFFVAAADNGILLFPAHIFKLLHLY